MFSPFYPLKLSTFLSLVLESFLPDSHFVIQGSAGPFWEALFLQSPAFQQHTGGWRHLFFWQNNQEESIVFYQVSPHLIVSIWVK